MTRGKIQTIALAVSLCALGLTVLMAAKGSNDKTTDAPPAKLGKRVVIIGEVSKGEQKVDVYPENFPQPSRVIKVLKAEGADVKTGEPLLEFDRAAYEIKVQEAENGIQIAMAEELKADAMVRMHKIEVAFYEKEWKAKEATLEAKQKELKEAERLATFMKVNQLELEAKQSEVKSAELSLEAARIKLDGFTREVPNYLVTLAKANVKLKQSMKTEAEHARDQLACKAPADGRIIRSFASEGMNFGPTTREPAFWFLKDGPLLVRAEVTQEFAGRIVKGQPATIQDDSDPSQTWKGRVTKTGDQFLPKRTGAGIFDFMPTSDDRVLECQISIDVSSGEAGPKFGQKVRVTLE